MSNKVYQIITDKIIKQLEAGKISWRQPWQADDAPRNIRGTLYHGVNVFLLNCERDAQAYKSNVWLTAQQAMTLGGDFAGQRTTQVIKWTIYESKNAAGKDERRFSLSYYNVFNLDQVKGLTVPAPAERDQVNPIDAADQIVRNMPSAPAIINGGSRAFYSPSRDEVTVPAMQDFNSANGYYSVLFHELGHATGHKSRLDRWDARENHNFGSADYSKEELVAEMTAAFLMGVTGIEREDDLKNAAAYLQSWIAALKNDNTLIIRAAAHAQKAADCILGHKLEAEIS